MSKSIIFTSDYSNKDALLSEFFMLHPFFSDDDKEKITSAWNFFVEKTKNEIRISGEPVYLHPLRVAEILAGNKMDADTIIAALLHNGAEYNISPEDIQKKFGNNVYQMILTTNKILNLPINTKRLEQSDAIRKMFFALADDARIILLTLADRLDRLRNINNYDREYQKILAEAAIDIWAPLADRLGMQKEKNEFEDLSLKYTNPDAFQQIKSIVAQTKNERALYLQTAVQKIQNEAEKIGIQIEITSRAKHFYSIYQKMRKKNKGADQLFDLLALRILCNTTTECYTSLGIVHNLWKPLDGRFKDYIAMPKSNGYQSLHTTVMCQDKPLEIQIRTFKMHDMAEHGIASHWLYKKGFSKDLIEEDKLDIFNKLQLYKDSILTDTKAFSSLKNELLGDEIYVFTPKGDVKKLPAGSTAIDFAYSIHSGIGEKIIAAKADGKIIPLTKPLQNTQIIEIITNPKAHPTEAQLKVVKTTKAHQKIHSWLMSNDETFCERINLEKEIDGNNSENIITGKENAANHPHKKNRIKNGIPPVENSKKYRVLIQGDKNVVYNIAQCCNPHYPELIMGYVTLNKGISIHRADCLVYQRILNKEKRSVEACWDDSTPTN